MADSNEAQVECSAPDRRTARTRAALRAALAEETLASGSLADVTVAALSERAGITRRTFYTHYHDVDELVAEVEEELIAGIAESVASIVASDLDDLHERIERREAAPGAVELLTYIYDNGDEFKALLGPGGDASFGARIEDTAVAAAVGRASEGLPLGPDAVPIVYYVTSVVCGMLGVIRAWVVRGMAESVQAMAIALTMFAFVRPGDLYGKPLDFDVLGYVLALVKTNPKEL